MAQVTVGCKLPHGLILQLPKTSQRVTLRGANSNTVLGLDGKVARGTCGYTKVDDAFIQAWLKLYAQTTMVKNGLIFVAKNEAEAKAEAADTAAQKTGFEAVDPDKPAVPGIKPVEAAGKTE